MAFRLADLNKDLWVSEPVCFCPCFCLMYLTLCAGHCIVISANKASPHIVFEYICKSFREDGEQTSSTTFDWAFFREIIPMWLFHKPAEENYCAEIYLGLSLQANQVSHSVISFWDLSRLCTEIRMPRWTSLCYV